MTYAVYNKQRAPHAELSPQVQVDVPLVRGVLAGLLLVAPFWLFLMIAVLKLS